jgi:hypothetical protein
MNEICQRYQILPISMQVPMNHAMLVGQAISQSPKAVS